MSDKFISVKGTNYVSKTFHLSKVKKLKAKIKKLEKADKFLRDRIVWQLNRIENGKTEDKSLLRLRLYAHMKWIINNENINEFEQY